MASLRMLLLVALVLAGAGCKRPYRVGEYVLVEWEKGAPPYPAYIVEQKGSKLRVHFEGYDARWDEDVSIDRVVGRAPHNAIAPPPPAKVAAAAGSAPAPSSSANTVAPYRVGDRVRVVWRGSAYPATVIAVEAPDRFRIHYDGYESAWDESIHIERIRGRR